jgi:hypothetical protein
MTAETLRKPDALTVAAIAAAAYAICAFAHEAGGHGGACVLVGCRPQLLTSMSFDGDASLLPASAVRIIAAGGSIVNAILALVGFLWLRRIPASRSAMWFFCWLLATISLLQATGYLMFSGLGGVGDWAVVVADLPGGGLWRGVLAVAGGVSYWLAVRYSMQVMGRRLASPAPQRAREAYGYPMLAYFVGGALGLVGGLFDPNAAAILLISGVAASLGGTSGLLWGPQLLRNPAFISSPDPLAPMQRSLPWIVIGAIAALVHVFVLGPGLHLS